MIFTRINLKKIFLLLNGSLIFNLTQTQAQWSTADASGNVHNTNTGNITINGNVGYPSFGVGVTTNRANSIAQFLNSLGVVADNNTTIAYNGAYAYNFYNSGVSPTFAGTYMQHVGTGISGNLYGLVAANQGTLVFQNVSNGVIASNGANIMVSPASNVAATFLANGNVLIGKSSQTNSSYKFEVAGDIRVNKVVVNTTGADFVFQPEYRLPPLDSVSAYISANRHLPGVPSADSMSRAGLDLGSNQTILLQKIEELTLYSIQLKAEVEELRKQNKMMLQEIRKKNK